MRQDKPENQDYIVSHLFRQEYAKMTAVLCRHFGLKHIEIAEDIASETFLKASESWAIHGVPENPTAWLYTVAKNKTKDYFKRASVFEIKAKEAIKLNQTDPEHRFEYNDQIISDSQLAMIFAVCNPKNSTEAQICLALQILCGFSVGEIANAFLTNTETVKKRLYRARVNLRTDNFQIKSLGESEIISRLNTVLKTLYLLFNEGYFSKASNQLIRKDLCSEAMRLTLVLAERPLTDTPETNALLALMCFQSSRLEARTSTSGEAVLFDEQDKSLWDKTLIEKGNYFLIKACNNNEVSKYHLEAGIAYWHTTATGLKKWQHILKLYNQLVIIENSPVTVLNRAFAYAKVYGHDKAIAETQKLQLTGSSYFHALLGYLHARADNNQAIFHYEQAIKLSKSRTEKQTLSKEIQWLKKRKGADTRRVS